MLILLHAQLEVVATPSIFGVTVYPQAMTVYQLLL